MTTLLDVQGRLKDIAEWSFCEGVSRDEIETAEASFLGSFPEDFVEYLAALGSCHVESEEFLGLGGEPHLNIVETARFLREPSQLVPLPEHLVPVRGDGFGNYDCVDLSASDGLRSRLVAWVHDAPDGEPEVLCTGYWDWFNEVLNMATGADGEAGEDKE